MKKAKTGKTFSVKWLVVVMSVLTIEILVSTAFAIFFNTKVQESEQSITAMSSRPCYAFNPPCNDTDLLHKNLEENERYRSLSIMTLFISVSAFAFFLILYKGTRRANKLITTSSNDDFHYTAKTKSRAKVGRKGGQHEK